MLILLINLKNRVWFINTAKRIPVVTADLVEGVEIRKNLGAGFRCFGI